MFANETLGREGERELNECSFFFRTESHWDTSRVPGTEKEVLVWEDEPGLFCLMHGTWEGWGARV